MKAIRGAGILLAVLLWAAAAGPQSGSLVPLALAQSAADWQTRETRWFTISYTAADAETVEQYAAVVDDLYQSVANVFDLGPTAPVPLRLYPTVEAYGEANPIARFVSGVVAHADPRRGEIGVATPRLVSASPAQVRDTIRHELTHLAATELTRDRLPIGFQEGLAQYVEREAGDRRDLARALGTARAQGRLLTLAALNEPRRFIGRINVAYPQSLSLVAYLLDREGPAAFKRYLLALRDGDGDWEATLASVYGRSLAEIEADWRDYLPEYLAGRWQVDVLAPLDLAEAQARLDAREYEAARARFAEAQRLHLELDQPRLAALAERGEQRAEALLAAVELSARGRAALTDRAYRLAADLLARADEHYGVADDAEGRASLATALGEARLGSDAEDQLAEAATLLASWRYPEGRARSLEAAQLYSQLDDTAGWQRAVALQAEAEAGQRRVALALVLLGVLVLSALALWWARGLRRRARAAAPLGAPAREEGISL